MIKTTSPTNGSKPEPPALPDQAEHLITPAYLAEQLRLHERGGYGVRGDRWGPLVARYATGMGCRDILDYGCGAGALERWLAEVGFACRGYDPAIAGKHQAPEPADLVACIDVLEHIEPASIDAVGDHLRFLTRRCLIAGASLRPAGKTLSDGTNAHVLIRPGKWWSMFFVQHGFIIKALHQDADEWSAVMKPR